MSKSPRSTRVSSPGEAIDFERYIPTVLSRLVSRLRGSSNVYFHRRYGLSLLDWRIITFLAAEGPSSAYTIWTEGGLDKAAVSRALRGLAHRGLVAIDDAKGLARRRKTVVSLTAAGVAMHDDTFAETLLRHARFVHGLSAADLETLLATLAHLEGQIMAMGDETVPADLDYRITKRIERT